MPDRPLAPRPPVPISPAPRTAAPQVRGRRPRAPGTAFVVLAARTLAGTLAAPCVPVAGALAACIPVAAGTLSAALAAAVVPLAARAAPAEPATAGRAPGPTRPVHTYSIVARDPATGQLGVAVQSHWFSVGAIVPWAEAGVGAVATQSFVDPSYGPLGLELLRAGRTAPEALAGLLAADAGRDVRQVAMVDAKGRVAAHTGARCIAAAGQHVGKDFSVQANLMANGRVWPAMARAFEAAKGDLADRMLAALDAAQAEGGDIRGQQSAALVVVAGTPSGRPWADRILDLRVEDHPRPLEELRRLVGVARAYAHMNAGDLAVEHKDMAGAEREYGAAAKLLPDSAEVSYWYAVALASNGQVERALPLFARAYALDPAWRELTPRLPASGLLPDDPKLVARLRAAGAATPAGPGR